MTTFLRKLGDMVRRGRQRRFSAIDFDSRHLRIAQGEQTAGGARIVKLATADVPEGLDMADPQAFGALLGRTLDQMRLRNTSIIMSVPRGQAVLKPVILPPVATTSELAGMVQYQAEKELSFRPDEAVVDFTLESHYGIEHAGDQEAEGEHVLVAAVRRPVVEYYQAVANAAGARLLRLGLRPYANMRCVQAYVPHEAAGRVALVHVTADEVEIDVMEAGALAFSRSAVVKVPAAGGLADPAVRDAVGTVVTEVTRSLQSFVGVERDHRIDVLLVSGGTGIEPHVREELSNRLSVRCELLNPAPALGLEDSGPAASAFVPALGLALGQGSEAALPFDFLNPKRPVIQRDLKKAATIAAVAALVLALLTVIGSAALYYYAAESRVSGLTEEYNKLKEGNRKIGALAKRVETVDSWVRAGRNWLDQWAYLSAVFPSCTDVYATNLKTNPDGSVNFTVKAKSNEAINELGKRLAAAGYDFKPGQVTSGSDPYGYTYATTIKVMVKPGMKVDLASASPVPRPEDDVSAKEFGKPSAAASSAAASGATSGGAAGPAAAGQPGPDAPYSVRYKAWMGQYEALMKVRPPESEAEASAAWRAKREALRAEMPKVTPSHPPPSPHPPPSRPPPSSGSGTHRHE